MKKVDKFIKQFLKPLYDKMSPKEKADRREIYNRLRDNTATPKDFKALRHLFRPRRGLAKVIHIAEYLATKKKNK